MILKAFNSIIRSTGWQFGKLPASDLPVDFEPLHRDIFQKVKTYTMTSRERVFGLIEAVRHVQRHRIPGSIVECGVWKGGSMLACAETLLQLGQADRELWLYDTFEGMPPPDQVDRNASDELAGELLDQEKDKTSSHIWAYSGLEEVKATLRLSAYPSEKIRFIQGKVEDTIPAQLPGSIALLRLDTDWYSSTRHELQHLFPLLSSGGILIIDDYGFWKGARQAVDEYFAETGIPIFLTRMDETGRMAVKP